MTKGFVKKLIRKHKLVSWYTVQGAVTVERSGDFYFVTKDDKVEVFGGFNRTYKNIRKVLR